MSTAYLPSVQYMAFLQNSGDVIIEKEETYPKQTYRNRCRILTANGIINLSIPVEKPNGNQTKTKDIAIINSTNWFTNHWRAITSAYSSSPFFLYYKDDLQKFYTGRYDSLLEYNTELIKMLLKLAGISCSIKYSNSFAIPDSLSKLKNPTTVEPNLDLRFSIIPKKEINTTSFTEYTQVFSAKFGFTPNLSFIDLLFNLGPETKNYLKSIAL